MDSFKILPENFNAMTVLYPELFWSQYTGLGFQTQTLKCSKVLISGVSFRQCSLSQNQESDVLSYSEHKIAKNFQGFTPGPHWGGLTALPQTPQLHNSFFSMLHLLKNQHAQKIAGYGTRWARKLQSIDWNF